MKASKIFLAIGCLAAAFFFASHASAQEIRNTRLSSAGMQALNASLGVSDDKFTGQTGWISGFANKSNYARVEFGVDEELHVFHSTFFRARVTFDVTLTDASFNTVTHTAKQIEVTYDPATSYKDKAQLTWNNYYRVDITNIVLQAFDAGGNPLGTLPTDVYLQAEIGTARIYTFNPGTTTMGYFDKALISASNDLEIRWDFVTGADEYELEWLYVDDYTDIFNTFLSNSAVSYDLLNDASRIITPFNYYRIPLTYEHGYIVYRLRPIGRTTTGTVCDGAWTTVPVSSTISAAQGSSAASVYAITSPFQSDAVNWSSVKTFAETGKAGIGVSFSDGLMHGHQSIARLNSDNKSIVQSTLYDNYGRPVFNMLPAPVSSTNLSYVQNLNKVVVSGNSVLFDKSVFGTCAGNTCGQGSSYILDTVNSVGAANYFSASNPNKTGFKGYSPTAKGIPYTQVQYLPDATGRIARQTLPGLTHQLNSGKETQFYYSNAAQVEIDRLFGSEAGKAIFYKKNYVADANGQVSAVYLDKFGRTVATSLVGDAPTSVDALPPSDKTPPVSLTDNLVLFNSVPADEYCKEANTTFFVQGANDQQSFVYSTTLGTFIAQECSTSMCLNCAYDLTISIKDDCGVEVFKSSNSQQTPATHSSTIGAQSPYSSNCQSNYQTQGTIFQLNSTPITITFPHPGVYTVYKKICVSDAPVEDYTNIYLNDAACNKTLCYYADSLMNAIDFSQCAPSCASCGSTDAYNSNVGSTTDALNAQGLGPYYPPIPTATTTVNESGNPGTGNFSGPNSLSVQEYCSEFCNTKNSTCEFYSSILEQDFYPGGQFGATSSSQTPNWTYSIFNTSNSLAHYNGSSTAPSYTNPPLPFKNSDGSISVVNIGGVNYYPQQLSLANFLAYWQNSWAASFLPIHPEYCKLDFYCSILNCAMKYDQEMLDIDNYDDACSGGYIKPVTGLTFTYGPPTGCSSSNPDPTFCSTCPTGCSQISATYLPAATITAFNNKLTTYTNTIDIYEFATQAAGYGTTPTGYTFGSSVCTKDQEWIQFRTAYLALKYDLYQTILSNYLRTNPAGCYTVCTSPCSYGVSHFGTPNDSLQGTFGTGVVFPSTVPMSTTTYTNTNTSFTTSTSGYVTTQCSTNCASYVSLWVAQLTQSCPTYTTFSTATQNAIKADLQAVCNLGCDGAHPYGSSDFPTTSTGYTIPGSSPAVVVHSFQGVLNYYFGLNGSQPVCDVNIFTAPQPFNYTGAGTTAPSNYLDDCGCDKLLQTDYDYTNGINVPSGITSARKLFKHRFGFDLPSFNQLACACKGVIYSSTWSPGYTWTSQQKTDLLNQKITIPPDLKCSNCVSCSELNTTLTNMVTQYNISPSNTTGILTFFNTNSQQALNYLNFAMSASFTLQQYRELLLDCDQFASTGNLQNTLTYNVEPELAALELYLDEMAKGNILSSDHTMKICTDQNFFLSSLYTGPLPLTTAINYFYDATISGLTLTIQVKDANNGNAVLCTITLTLPSGSAVNWANVKLINNFMAYAATPVAGPNYGFKADVDDGTNTATITGSNTCWPTCRLTSTSPYEPEMCTSGPAPFVNECKATLIKGAMATAQTLYNQYIDVHINQFVQNYKTACFNAINETFTRTYDFEEYHFTLYYYDQGGNLTRTVAPMGVDPLSITSPLSTTSYPVHSANNAVTFQYVNKYQFNSYNQPNTEATIDGGGTTFFYDLLGRIVASQNAKQAAAQGYSYTLYDNLGRIKEVGEVTQSTALTEATAEDLASGGAFLTWLGNGTRKQVIATYYDAVFSTAANAWFTNGQENLRNRVVSTTYEEIYDGVNTTYDYGTHYSYDEHGNVKQLVQEYQGLSHLTDQKFKTVLYEYDLISGNVNLVTYQPNQPDLLMHKYLYDDDNRLHEVFTSRDGANWDHDAKYYFHEYGPLARVETGDKKVQGTDYFYTLNGWIKGYNSDMLNENTDPGKDAANTTAYSTIQGLHAFVGRDAASFNLNYYRTSTEEDYVPVKTYNTTTDVNPLGNKANLYSGSAAGFVISTDGANLFNGNISSMATTLVNKDANVTAAVVNAPFVQIAAYRYDQLYRLKQMKTYRQFSHANQFGIINAWATPTTGNSDNSYLNQFTYDKNGNILTQLRNGADPALRTGSTLALDNLTYYYDFSLIQHTNRLMCVGDAVNSAYTDDIDDQSTPFCVTNPNNGSFTSSNYTYDAIGNLASDKQECIATIEWTVDRKVKKITRDPARLTAAGKTLDDIEYQYDASRRRICKITKPRDATTKLLKDQSNWVYTYYTYDASGNVLATYKRTYTLSGGTYTDHYDLTELDLFGSKRLGIIRDDAGDITYRDFTATISNGLFTGISYNSPPSGSSTPVPLPTTRYLGKKEFELTNHLGNVITTVSDRKLQDEYGTDNTLTANVVDYYTPDILSTSDYYPFGTVMGGRNYQATSTAYRYGMNGQEKETEVLSGAYSAEYWMYDARLGRRWEMDPLAYADQSPYAAFNNNPIYFSDPLGLEGQEPQEGTIQQCGDGTQEQYFHGEWIRYIELPTVTFNPNPYSVPNNLMTSPDAIRYIQNSSSMNLEPAKFSWKFEPWKGYTADSRALEMLQYDWYGSRYSLFYDGMYIGQFQSTKTGLVWSSGLNDDFGGKIDLDLKEFFIGLPGAGGGIDIAQVAGEDMVNGSKPETNGAHSFGVLNAGRVRVAKVNLNAKANSYNSFLSSTGLKSNKFSSQLYWQFKNTGVLLYQGGKPVLQVMTKFDIKAAVDAGLTPVLKMQYDQLQNQAQDLINSKE